jgi:hypothetical protein
MPTRTPETGDDISFQSKRDGWDRHRDTATTKGKRNTLFPKKTRGGKRLFHSFDSRKPHRRRNVRFCAEA